MSGNYGTNILNYHHVARAEELFSEFMAKRDGKYPIMIELHSCDSELVISEVINYFNKNGYVASKLSGVDEHGKICSYINVAQCSWENNSKL